MANPTFYCVIGNRDYLKVEALDGPERRPIWQYVEGQRHWLTSLVYLKKGWSRPVDSRMFFDCGAWSYKSEAEPHWSPEQCAERYAADAVAGDIVAAPDHMVLRDHDAQEQTWRIDLTLRNARRFLDVCPRHLTPIAVTHGNSLDARLSMTQELLGMGYRAIAIGSVAARAGNRKFVRAVLDATVRLREQSPFYLHVLGVSALSWCQEFAGYGVDSYDGSSMFFAAFTGAEYFWVLPDGTLTEYSAKGDIGATPLCDCPPCAAMRAQGIDTRQMGSNENNMGRAVHNINMYRRALAQVQTTVPTSQQLMLGELA